MHSRLSDTWPPVSWQDVTVLVAVSGGADSVAVLRALRSLKKEGKGGLLAAHFNHRLRGEESDADESFVADLCRKTDVKCEVGRAREEQFEAASNGIEAAARTARYDFLRETAARVGARYVVTGHTADDQAETILHHILRGTGIAGLAGMARARPLGTAATLIRPLLGFRRNELVAYLAELGQPFRSDSSNADRAFTRNRIRCQLLPELAEQYNPEVIESLLRLGRLAGEVQTIVDTLVADLHARAVTYPLPCAVHISLTELAGEPPYIVRELFMAVWRRSDWPLQSMGFREWDLLARMAIPCPALPGPAKQMLPGGILAEARTEEVRLNRVLPR
jgi:tRNA(Ile)-lysidine synthase